MKKTIKLSKLGDLKNGLNYSGGEIANPIKIIGVADFQNNTTPDYDSLGFVDSSFVSSDYLLEEGDIVFVRSNGNKNLVGRIMIIKNIQEPITFSGFCIRFRPNKSIVNPEYVFFALKCKYCKSQYSYSQQTNITNLSQDILDDVDIPFCNLEDQNKSIALLSKINDKINLNKKIINQLENLGITYFDFIFREKYTNNLSQAKKVGDYVGSNIGKQYAGFSTPDGKFRFFSCSKDIQWCDEYEFSGKSLIVSTHGDFHVEHFSGCFNAYFCNLIFTPKDEKQYGVLYFALKKQMDLLQRKSVGSVIKFISNEEICSLPIFMPESSFEYDFFNSIVLSEEVLEVENINLIKNRDYLTDLFISGQARID